MTTKLKLTQAVYLGWDAYILENEFIQVICVPQLGGRIMAYNLGEYPYLYINRDLTGKLFSAQENLGDGSVGAWKNYGGDKTWPAPQGWDNQDQWPGPPDPILDTGIYQVTRVHAGEGELSIEMTSPEGSQTGMQIVRGIEIHPASSKVVLTQTFRNLSDRTRCWSIWDITQFQAEKESPGGGISFQRGCRVSAPVNPESKELKGYWVLYGDASNPQWMVDPELGLFIGDYQYQLGKAALDSRAGWLGFSNQERGYAFGARFPVYENLEYPDQGATVEFWTVGSGKVQNLDFDRCPMYYLECEVLSPRFKIEPGQQASFKVEWGAARCGGPVVNVVEVGLVKDPLKVKQTNTSYRISGEFGVFDSGEAEIVACARSGNVVGNLFLGNVSPERPVVVRGTLDTTKPIELIQLVIQTNRGRFVLAEKTL